MGLVSQDRVAPRFIKAKTPKSLQRRMELMILRSMKQYDFYVIHESGGEWFAWYREKLDSNTMNMNNMEGEDA
jgi:hypothetical protein